MGLLSPGGQGGGGRPETTVRPYGLQLRCFYFPIGDNNLFSLFICGPFLLSPLSPRDKGFPRGPHVPQGEKKGFSLPLWACRFGAFVLGPGGGERRGDRQTLRVATVKTKNIRISVLGSQKGEIKK